MDHLENIFGCMDPLHMDHAENIFGCMDLLLLDRMVNISDIMDVIMDLHIFMDIIDSMDFINKKYFLII